MTHGSRDERGGAPEVARRDEAARAKAEIASGAPLATPFPAGQRVRVEPEVARLRGAREGAAEAPSPRGPAMAFEAVMGPAPKPASGPAGGMPETWLGPWHAIIGANMRLAQHAFEMAGPVALIQMQQRMAMAWLDLAMAGQAAMLRSASPATWIWPGTPPRG